MRIPVAIRAAALAALLGGPGEVPAQQPPEETRSSPAGGAAQPAGAPVSPLARMRNGRAAAGNDQIVTTGVRAPHLPVNHALIITVSDYPHSPLPGVENDRRQAGEIARRFGVPPANIVELSEKAVTSDGLRDALAALDARMLPGDRLFVYYSGHGARYYSQASHQCEEALVSQTLHVLPKHDLIRWLKPLSRKADKTIVMLDSCYSGGFAESVATRGLALASGLRPKFSNEASSSECAAQVNTGFAETRGLEAGTTDQNLVVLAAARKNEAAWDSDGGGAMTANFVKCLDDPDADLDHSGSLSMDELTACVQARLDKSQKPDVRQHPTLGGNGGLIPSFAGTGTGKTEPLATLRDIFAQRDDRWAVTLTTPSPVTRIGESLAFDLTSERDGYVYLFYRGSQGGSLYLLFPNELDAANRIAAHETLRLPRPAWSIQALGPAGTDTLLALVTETPRDFSALALPAEYVSRAGPFSAVLPTAPAAAQLARLAVLSAAARTSACSDPDHRDPSVARQCSNVFGAALLTVEERP